MLLLSLPFRILLEQCPQKSPAQEPSHMTLPLGYPPMAGYKLFEDSLLRILLLEFYYVHWRQSEIYPVIMKGREHLEVARLTKGAEVKA